MRVNDGMTEPVVHASQLIRRPQGEVFAAFVNPQTLRKFWLKDATGPLGPRARVRWEFMVPGATADVVVTHFEAPHRLGFDWPDMHVEMTFEGIDKAATRVEVAVSNLGAIDVLANATTTIEGFAIVLCDLKTLLETGQSAGLVRDKAELITRSMPREA
jgi:uncharacterized protein YndB with AHSA1/START domain